MSNTAVSSRTNDLGVSDASSFIVAAAKSARLGVTNQVQPDSDGVVHLPAGTSVDAISVDGNNILLQQPDGSFFMIEGGALSVPTIVTGDVEIPKHVLSAVLHEGSVEPTAAPPVGGGGAGGVAAFNPGSVGETLVARELLDDSSETFSSLAPLSRSVTPTGNAPLTSTSNAPLSRSVTHTGEAARTFSVWDISSEEISSEEILLEEGPGVPAIIVVSDGGGVTRQPRSNGRSDGDDVFYIPSSGDTSSVSEIEIAKKIKVLDESNYDVRVLEITGAGNLNTGLTVVVGSKLEPTTTDIQYASNAVTYVSGSSRQYFAVDGITGGIVMTHALGGVSDAIRTDTVINLGPDGISVMAQTRITKPDASSDTSLNTSQMNSLLSLKPNLDMEVIYTSDGQPVLFITTTVKAPGDENGDKLYHDAGGFVESVVTLTAENLHVAMDANNNLLWSDNSRGDGSGTSGHIFSLFRDFDGLHDYAPDGGWGSDQYTVSLTDEANSLLTSEVEDGSRIITDPQYAGLDLSGDVSGEPPTRPGGMPGSASGEHSEIGALTNGDIGSYIQYLDASGYDVQVLDTQGAESPYTGLTVITAYKLVPTDIQYVSGPHDNRASKSLQYVEGEGIQGWLSVTHASGDVPDVIRTSIAFTLGEDNISVEVHTGVKQQFPELLSLKPNVDMKVIYTHDDQPILLITTELDNNNTWSGEKMSGVSSEKYWRSDVTVTEDKVSFVMNAHHNLLLSDDSRVSGLIVSELTVPLSSPQDSAGSIHYEPSTATWMGGSDYLASLPPEDADTPLSHLLM